MLNLIFLQTPLKFMVASFWRDEAVSFLMAKGNIFQIISLTARDFNPPLYYLLLHYWMKIFGPSEIGLRLMSLIFFWAGLYVFFLFLVNVFKVKERWAFLYLILFLINPLLNYYAFEARMYSLFLFLGLLSYYFFWQKKPKGFIMVTILGLLTHYFMLFILLSQIIFVLIDRGRRREKLIFFNQVLKILLVFSLWVGFVLLQKNQAGTSFWISPPQIKNFIDIPAVIYTGYEYNLGYFNYAITVLAVALFLFLGYSFYRINWKTYRLWPDFNLLVIWNFLPFVIFLMSFYKPVFLPRYLIFTTPGLLFLIIYFLEAYPRQIKLSLISALLLITLVYNCLQINFRNKDDVRSVVTEIKSLMKPGDVIYVTSELNFHPTEYYLNDKQVYIFGKRYTDIPQYVGKVLIPKEKVINTLPFYPKRAFILKDNLSYDIQSIR